MEAKTRFSGWRMVVVAWFLGFFIIAPLTFGISVLMPPITKSLHMTATQLGLVMSSMGVVGVASSFLTAWLIHWIGIRWTLTIGLGFLVIGFLLLGGAVVTSFAGFVLVFGLSAGLGSGMFFVPIQNLIAAWFVKHRGTAMSIMFTGCGLGGLVAAVAISRILIATSSWRAVFLVFAACALVAGILVSVFVRNKPADVGQLPDGGRAGATVRTRRTYQTKVHWRARDVLRTPAYWLIVVATAITQGIAVPVILGFQGMAMASLHVPLATVGFIVGSLGICMVVGNLIVGPICDHIDARYVFGTVMALMIIGLGSFTLLNPARIAYAPIVYVVLFGVGSGSTYVLVPLLLANYFGVNNYATFAAVAGAVVAVVLIFFPTLTGRIYDTTGSYNDAWYLIMGLLGVAITCAVLAKPPRPKNVTAEEVGQTECTRAVLAGS